MALGRRKMEAPANAIPPPPPPPNAFGHALEEWIWNQFSHSIVMVEFRPLDADVLLQRWNNMHPLVAEAQQERALRSADTQCATGFVVRDTGDFICILTCAHVLGPVYNSQNPITTAEVEGLFDPRILCGHREERFRRHQDHHRQYIPARVARIRCSVDLMLLAVPRNQFVAYCDNLHRPIPMAANYPPPLHTVVMLSWPPRGHQTSVRGRTSHRGRHISAVSNENPLGYIVRLAEVDITADPGSSGAPLINGTGQFVAALHGRCDRGFAYFICYTDLHATLTAWGMMN